MKKIRIISAALCLLMILYAVTLSGAATSDPSVTAGCRTVEAAIPLGGSEKILDTATAVAVYERGTGTLVYGYQLDEVIYPSSMVKLMTALVAIQEGQLDDVVTVTRTALETVAVGSVSANLVRGEELTLRDLLYCMMVASANDASAVIAEYIGGSQEGFVDMMNSMAQQLGLIGTHFTNAHGLHDENNVTTVRDVMKLMDVALEDDTFREMFETVSYIVPATNKSDERSITSTNHMMNVEKAKYYDSRVTGGKTGATDQAGRCLAVTAQVGEMELIAIVMGAKAKYSADGSYITRYGSFEEMSELLDYLESGFEFCQLFYSEQVIDRYPVANGANDVAVTPEEEIYCMVPKGVTAQDLTWRYDGALADLTAPIATGQEITDLEVWCGDLCLATTKLVAMNSVAVDAVLSEDRVTQDEQKEQQHGRVLARILITVLVIAALIAGVYMAVRIVRTAMLKARVRRRRRNRRRNRNA